MKRLFQFASVLTVSLLLVTIQPATAGAKGTPSQFVFAGYWDVPIIDPHATDSGTAINIIVQACENLTRFKPGTSEIVPHLAERFEISDDLMRYTFYLRRGITFTDGAPFDARAVKVNVERILALGKGPSSRLGEVDTVKALDDHTVQMVLKHPSATFLYSLTAKAGLHILSPKALNEHATADDPWAENWFSNHMVGTGPYKLVEWIPKDRVILTRNEDYWGGWEGKHLHTIVRRTVPEYTTRKLLLEQGKAHMIDTPVGDDLPNLKKMPGVKVVELPAINVGWYLFIFTNDVMGNLDLRKAISWAFPYEEAAEIAGMGSKQLQGPMPSTIPGHNEELFIYHTDLDKAKERLAAAGYKKGELKLTLVQSTGSRNRRVYEVFRRNMDQIGVELKAEEMVWGQFSPWMASPAKGNAHMFMVAHWPDFPEPTSFLTLYFKNTDDFSPAGPRGYRNQRLNGLLTEAAKAAPERRNSLYKEAQKIIVDEALGVWAFQIFDAVAMRDSVKGYVFTPANFGVYDFYHMYLDE